VPLVVSVRISEVQITFTAAALYSYINRPPSASPPGQPLSLLLKQNTLITDLALYDV
jgi:hypothetical protein